MREIFFHREQYVITAVCIVYDVDTFRINIPMISTYTIQSEQNFIRRSEFTLFAHSIFASAGNEKHNVWYIYVVVGSHSNAAKRVPSKK